MTAWCPAVLCVWQLTHHCFWVKNYARLYCGCLFCFGMCHLSNTLVVAVARTYKLANLCPYLFPSVLHAQGFSWLAVLRWGVYLSIRQVIIIGVVAVVYFCCYLTFYLLQMTYYFNFDLPLSIFPFLTGRCRFSKQQIVYSTYLTTKNNRKNILLLTFNS